MLKNYFKIAWRNLTKHKGFTLINITGLTLGITACILISVYIVHETSYDRRVPDSENIYRILISYNDNGNVQRHWSMAAPMARTVEEVFEEVEITGRIMANNLFDGAGSNDIRLEGSRSEFHEEGFAYADQSIVDIFHLPLVYGDASMALKDPNSVIISQKKAKKFFGNENPVGKSMILNGNTGNPRTITGVMKDFPSNSHMKYDYFLTLSGVEFGQGEQTRWMQNNYFVYMKLNPETNVELFEKKFSDIIMKDYVKPAALAFNREFGSTISEKVKFLLQPLRDIHLYSADISEYEARGDIQIIKLFGVVALFILLIACINYVNLTTAKSANRAPEIGLRKVVGSDRKHLIFQFLTESILIASIVFVVGLILARLLLPFFNELAGRSLTFPWQEFWFLPALLIGIGVVGLLAGIYPALYLSGFYPIQVLKGGLRQGVRSKSFRTVLVVFQFAISTVLIVSTLVIYRQMDFILNTKLGYEKDQVLQLYSTNMVGDQIKTFKEELEKVNGVVSVSISDYLPIEGTKRNGNSFYNQGREGVDAQVSGQAWIVDEDYVETMGMDLIAGRNFSPEIASDNRAVIINQTMAQKLNLIEPIGKILRRGGNDYNIIGLIKDFNFRSLRQEVEPVAMFYGISQSIVSAKVRSTDLPTLLGEVESVWNEFVPNAAFRYQFMDASYANMYDNVYRTRSIFTSFAILAIFVACLGLFALSAFLVEQRRKELSIRKTLGASVQSILQLVTRHFIGLVCIAIVIGIPLAFFLMQNWLEDYAYRIEISWDIFIWASVLSLFTALFTISYHAIKSALANPAKNLRTE